MFSVLDYRITQNSYWKPNSSVLLSTSWILKKFIHFWEFLLLCGLVSNIFTMFFRDCFRWFLLFRKKSNIFIWREISKITGCPSIVTLTLLLFITFWEFLLLCGLVSNIFTMFFRDGFWWFLLFRKKSNIFIWREISKITCCPSIVTLTLLLFITCFKKSKTFRNI